MAAKWQRHIVIRVPTCVLLATIYLTNIFGHNIQMQIFLAMIYLTNIFGNNYTHVDFFGHNLPEIEKYIQIGHSYTEVDFFSQDLPEIEKCIQIGHAVKQKVDQVAKLEN